MSNNFLSQILSALLLICVVFGCVSCNKTTPPTEPSSTTQSAVETTTAPSTTETVLPPEEPLSFKLTADYKLVRPDGINSTSVAALQLLARGIKSAYGFDCEMITDITRKGAEVKPNEFEILVGATNRNESKAISPSLPYYDWTYDVVSENVIVICGGSPESTMTAVKAFLFDVFGYSEDENGNVLSAGTDATLTDIGKIAKAEYTVSSIKIGSRDFSEYSLVVTDEELDGISTVVGSFSRLCGKNMPVVAIEDYKGGPAIFLGCGKPDGTHHESSVYGSARYFITESDGNIFIDFKSKALSTLAAERFAVEYLPNSDASGSITVELKGDRVISGINIKESKNGLTLESTSSYKAFDGVIYEEHVYSDKDGAPVRAYFVIIKNAATIQTSMPSDSKTVGTVTSIKNQLTSALSNGKNAVAGINADFFDMGGTNVMSGLCIKDGEVLHSANNRPWFGITKDGKAVMGTGAEYSNYEGKLITAVGGSHIIIKNDKAHNIGAGSEFSDTRHPRTAVGVRPDGSVVFAVVDGRQPKVSNGASLGDLAFILGNLGCSDVINLDGGGSSTLILKNSRGSFNTMNSPSGSSLRAVANGLMVVLP